jgi:hypothetical protein
VYTTLTATWGGTGGGTGYTRMHWRGQLTTAEITQQLNAMRSFFGGFASFLPSAVSISYSGLAQEYDDAGVLKAELSVTPPAVTNGSGGTNWVASAGAVVNWNTGVFNDKGHRIRGRTYLVPLGTTAFGSNGGPNSTVSTNISTAANTLLGGLIPMVVVSRTKAGAYVAITSVTAAQVGTKAAVLTSRRD